MSTMVDLIVMQPARLAGVEEVLRTWGGEPVVTDPRVYRFEGHPLIWGVVPDHVQRYIGDVPPGAQCIAFPDHLLYDWIFDRLSDEDRATIERLVAAVERQPYWRVFYENQDSDQVAGHLDRECAPGTLLAHIGACVDRTNAIESATLRPLGTTPRGAAVRVE